MIPWFTTEQEQVPVSNLHLQGVEFLNISGEGWSDIQKSRFIESLILNIPVPPIVLFKNPFSSTKIVIDGRKRLQTIVEFRKDELKLTDLEFCPQLNGLIDWDLSHGIDGYIRQANAAFSQRRIQVITIRLNNEEEFTGTDVSQIIREGGSPLLF